MTDLVLLNNTDHIKAVRKELGDRNIFDSTADATAYELAEKHVLAASEKTNNFHGLAVLMGSGVETASRIVVATIGVRVKADTEAKTAAFNTYKGIVVFKQPTVQEFLDSKDDNVINFINKLIEREAADVAFGGLRAADDFEELETAVGGLPDTVEAIVENNRISSAAGQSSFDMLWSDFRKYVLKPKNPNVEKVLPQKPEILKAIRSKSYALANPATAPIEKADLFVKMVGAMIRMGSAFKNEDGEPAPIDTSDMQAWIDARDTHTIEFAVPVVKESDLANIAFE